MTWLGNYSSALCGLNNFFHLDHKDHVYENRRTKYLSEFKVCVCVLEVRVGVGVAGGSAGGGHQ